MGALDKFERLERTLSGMDEALNDYGEQLMESIEIDHLVVDLNIEQMKAGKDSNDNDITPPYKTKTIAKKIKKGQPYDRVTLRDEGDFQNSMKVRNANKKLEILSEDSKSGKLQDKYGEFIFGLNSRNFYKVQEYLKPKFLAFLRNYIRK